MPLAFLQYYLIYDISLLSALFLNHTCIWEIILCFFDTRTLKNLTDLLHFHVFIYNWQVYNCTNISIYMNLFRCVCVLPFSITFYCSAVRPHMLVRSLRGYVDPVPFNQERLLPYACIYCEVYPTIVCSNPIQY